MKQIDKDVLVTEIEQRRSKNAKNKLNLAASFEDNYLLSFINTLEAKDPYEECIQYDSIKTGIQANAEIYSFNIESKLFEQLTKEQQGLWREEIEQAYISGGDTGVEFARDTRYKENLEAREVDLEQEIDKELDRNWHGEYINLDKFRESAKHFFELGLKAQKGK